MQTCPQLQTNYGSFCFSIPLFPFRSLSPLIWKYALLQKKMVDNFFSKLNSRFRSQILLILLFQSFKFSKWWTALSPLSISYSHSQVGSTNKWWFLPKRQIEFHTRTTPLRATVRHKLIVAIAAKCGGTFCTNIFRVTGILFIWAIQHSFRFHSRTWLSTVFYCLPLLCIYV